MEINRIGKNKIEVKEGEKAITIEAGRVGRNILITISDTERTIDLALRRVESEKLIRALRRFGISDVRRVASYIAAMAEVRMIDAPRAVFMNVEDIVDVSTGETVGQLVETYYHTDGGWRLYTNNEVREVYNIVAPMKNIDKHFWHYNATDVSMDDVYSLADAAKEVKEVLKQYVVLEEKYYDVATAWIVLTYMRWASPYSELLVIRKPGFGQGGSTLLKTVRLLSARPLRTVVNTSPAAFYRIVDFAMPTIALDEIREDEADAERLAELKLLAESAFDEENVVLRVEDGEEVTSFSTFANVAVVDSTDKFTTYSSERRAWTVVIRSATPPKLYDRYEILKATEELRGKLYSIGIVLPTAFYPKWRQLAAEQGVGALKAVVEIATSLGQDAAVLSNALAAVAAQLAYARETAALSDPKQALVDIINRILHDARRELEDAARVSNPHEVLTLVEPEDADYKCGAIYLSKLIREIRRRAIEIDRIVTSKLDNVYYTTTEHRYWFRVAKDLEMYIKPAKIKAVLQEMDINVVLDQNRNYVVRVCRE